MKGLSIQSMVAPAALLWLACLSDVSAGQPQGLRTASDPAGAQTPAEVRLQIDRQGAELRAAARASSDATLADDATAPELLAAKIVNGRKFNVLSPPAAPTVQVEFSEDSSGLYYVYVQFISPSHNRYASRSYYSPIPQKRGTLNVQLFPPAFNFYSEPGTWTLNEVYLQDRAGNGRYYQNADLSAVLSGSPDIEVTNSRTPDVTPPDIDSGMVLTPMVGKNGYFRVRFDSSDDISGVQYAYACFSSPSNTTTECAAGAAYPDTFKLSVTTTGEGKFDHAEAGTWTMSYAYVGDVAGNTHFYSGSQLNALFPDGTTIEVSP